MAIPDAVFDGATVTRRQILAGVIAAVVAPTVSTTAHRRQPTDPQIGPPSTSVLPSGIRSRFVDNVNGLRMHVLEAGFETPGRQALLLVHGFPELAYSWRKVMAPLAAAGYHVFARDVRGYGRTSASPVAYTDDLRPFGSLNKIRDMLTLVSAMGYRAVAAVIGHDQGSPLAGWCALARPDVFKAVVMMSAPFGGAPPLPFNSTGAVRPASPARGRFAAWRSPLLHLQPRP